MNVGVTKFDICDDVAAGCSLEPVRGVGVVVEKSREIDREDELGGTRAAIRIEHTHKGEYQC
jgi:hypothetical protein